MWNLKHGTNEAIWETERGSDAQDRLVVITGEGFAGGVGWETGLADASYHTRKGEQQGLTAQHRELCSLFHDEP